jgi:hypothetical protein
LYNDECKEATKNNNEAYYNIIQKYYIRGTEEQCKEMRIEKSILRKKKRRFYEEQIKQGENPICKRRVEDFIG